MEKLKTLSTMSFRVKKKQLDAKIEIFLGILQKYIKGKGISSPYY